MKAQLGKGVNANRHRLSRTNLGQLGFLVVRRNVERVRDCREEDLSRLNEVGDLDLLVGDGGGLGGVDLRIRQIELRLRQDRPLTIDYRQGLTALGFEYPDMGARRVECREIALQGGLTLAGIGLRLLPSLGRAISGLG